MSTVQPQWSPPSGNDTDAPRPVRCDNCDWEGDESNFPDNYDELEHEQIEGQYGKPLWLVHHLNSRLDEGSEVPVGECPDCQCFCYLAEESTEQKLYNALRLIQTAYTLAPKSTPANLRRAILDSQKLTKGAS